MSGSIVKRLRCQSADERVAPQILARLAFALEQPLDYDLRRNTGVIDAWLPQRVVALHALVPDQHVLKGAAQRMPHVQRARDIGRRHRNDVSRLARAPRCACLEDP
jgi:hypothetical protein